MGILPGDSIEADARPLVVADNRVVQFAKRLGGRVKGVMRDQFGPGRAGVLIGILKHEWRFYPPGWKET